MTFVGFSIQFRFCVAKRCLKDLRKCLDVVDDMMGKHDLRNGKANGRPRSLLFLTATMWNHATL